MRVLSVGAKQRGNSLMEYAVPAAIILLTVGVLGTFLDIQGLMGQYFSAASGHTRSDIQGATLNVTLNSANLAGQTGTGSSGFDERIIITDGNGRRIEVGGTPGANQHRGGVSGTNGTTNQEEHEGPIGPLSMDTPVPEEGEVLIGQEGMAPPHGGQEPRHGENALRGASIVPEEEEPE